MTPVVIPAHFDGERIQLDEPVKLEPNARLLVQVLSSDEDDEREEWRQIALQALSRCYGEDEPEYTLADLKEINPYFEGR